MTHGRRASEGEVPTTIWMDPPNQEEVQILLVALRAIRAGEVAPEDFPGAASKGTLRVRGLDAPPRQGCTTPVPSTPESVAEDSPREDSGQEIAQSAGG